MNENKPIAQFHAGCVFCSIWKNMGERDGRPVPFFKAQIVKRYLDDEGKWQSTAGFSRNDIPLAIHVLQKAFEFMLQPQEAVEPADVAIEPEPQ